MKAVGARRSLRYPSGMKRRGWLGAIFVVALAVACTDLRVANDEPIVEDGGSDAGSQDDAGGEDVAVRDAAKGEVPPTDRACAEAWTVEAKADAACAARKVTDLGVITTGTVALDLAVTPSRRIGIVTNRKTGPESGSLVFVGFPAASSMPTTPTILTRDGVPVGQTNEYMEAGHLAAIAAVGPDTFGIFSHEVEFGSAGDVVYLEQNTSSGDLEAKTIVANGVASYGSISAASDAAGHVYFAYLARSQPNVGLIKATARDPAATDFTPLPNIEENIALGGAPVGHVSLAMLDTGEPHAAFHVASTKFASYPRYAQFSGFWTGQRTLVPMSEPGQHGFYVRVGSHGTRRYALYFSVPFTPDASSATAELRLSTWDGSTGAATAETLATGIPCPSALAPSFDAALAVDRFGLVHVAWVEPGTETKQGALLYKRQTRLAGGALAWLDDVVDPAVTDASFGGRVALAVDAMARPHIAYLGSDTKLRYATRFDR